MNMKEITKREERVILCNNISEIVGRRIPLTDATNTTNMNTTNSRNKYNLKLRKHPSPQKRCSCCIEQTNNEKDENNLTRKLRSKRKRNKVQKSSPKIIPDKYNLKGSAQLERKSVDKKKVSPTKRRYQKSQKNADQSESHINDKAQVEDNITKEYSPKFVEHMKSAYILIENNQEIEKRCKKRIFNVSPLPTGKRASNPLAVYEFVYDENEGPPPKPKRKRRPKAKNKNLFNIKQFKKLHFNVVTTHKPPKEVVILLPKVLNPRKVPASVEPAGGRKETKPSKEIKNILNIVTDIRELPEFNEKVEKETLLTEVRNINHKLDELKRAFNVVHNISVPTPVPEEPVVEDHMDLDDCNVPSPVPYEEVCEVDNVAEEITKSFMECNNEPNSPIQTSNPKTPIRILSNVVIREGKTTPGKEKIFNSTFNTSMNEGSPWRLNLSIVRNNPYMFNVKNSNFTPSYDENTMNHSLNLQERTNKQGMIEKSRVVEAVNLQSRSVTFATDQNSFIAIESANQNNISKDNQVAEVEKSKENVAPSAKSHQTSILEFIVTEKSQMNNSHSNLPVTPRKPLGTLNQNQVASLISPKPYGIFESPSATDKTGSLFGFSFLSDDDKENENRELSPEKRKPIVKDKMPARFSPGKVKRPLFKDNVEEKQQPVPAVKEEQLEHEKIEDVQVLLFKDVDDLTTKHLGRRYERRTPKRQRLVSVDSIESEHDESPDLHPKKKRKDVRSKEEEEEAEKLAKKYNEMFDEIAKYNLCIE